MSLNKLILLAGVLLAVLSCHQAPKPEIITSYDIHFETLHGKVKQLREMYRVSKFTLDTNIIDFDIRGNAIQVKNIGDNSYLAKYVYVYDQAGKKISATTKDSVKNAYFQKPLYKYDTNGRIVEMSSPSDEAALYIDTPISKIDFSTVKPLKVFYKYDAAGNMIQEDCYYEQKQDYDVKFKYNDQHLLIEEVYLNGNKEKPEGYKETYHYTSFDSKGNWLRRVGEITDIGPIRQEVVEPVMVRKITYY